MKISVVMATYTGVNFLEEQLQSIKLQTKLPDQLVVVDDCSLDGTLEILSEFARGVVFDVLIERNTQRLGVAQTFSRALELASGDLVFLSDQDDVWFPSKIEKISRIAENSATPQVFINDAEITNGELVSTGLTRLQQVRNAGMGSESYVMGCATAVRAEFLRHFLPIPLGLQHDDWISNVSTKLNLRHIEQEILQMYRRHGSNVSDSLTSATKKVGRRHVWFRELRRTGSKNIAFSLEHLSRLEASLVGAGLAESRAESPEWRKRILKLQDVLQSEVDLTKTRISARRLGLFRRLRVVAFLLIRKRYSTQPFKSAIRDILG